MLLNSNVIEDYPWLKEFLQTNPELSDDQLAHLHPDQRNFIENIFSQLVKQAHGEWRGDPDRVCEDRGSDRSNWEKCSLCHQPNRLIFYIINTLNHNALNVGSDCIHDFEDRLGDTVTHLAKNARELRRVTVLNGRFPGIGRLIDEWSNELDRYPILIPLQLENRHKDIGRQLTLLFEAFRGGKKNESAFGEFAELLAQRNELMAEIDGYVTEHEHDRFAPTKRITTWVRTHSSRETDLTIPMLKEDGIIKERTLWRIEEPLLVRSLVPDFAKILGQVGIVVESADTNYSGTCGYVLSLPSHHRIKLFCRHKDLAMEYAGPIFGIPLGGKVRAEDVVSLCQVYDDETSLGAVVDQLRAVMRNSAISLDDYYLDLDEVDVLERNSARYVVAPLRKLADEFKGLALGLEGKTPEDLVRWVAALPGKRLTRRELRDSRRASAGMSAKWDNTPDADEK